MKNLKLPLLLLLMLLGSNVQSDIILNEPRRALIYVRLQNAEDFPEYTVIRLYRLNIGLSEKYNPLELKQDSYYVNNFYKPITFAAVRKQYLQGKDIKDIDWKNDKHVIMPDSTLTSNKAYPGALFYAVEFDYKIAGFTDSTMVIYKSSEKYKFRIRPDSILNFEYTGDLTKLSKSMK